MTISTTTTRQDFTGGTTAYDFSFKVMDEAWVKVDLDGVEQAAGWSVALNADQDVSPGGTVTFLVAPAAGVSVRVSRQVPLTQETALGAYSPFPSKTVERTFDRVVMQAQDLARETADAEERSAALIATVATEAAGKASTAYVEAAIASAIASPAVPDSTTLKTAAARLVSIPLEVPGARKAKTLGLRANLQNRRRFSTGLEYFIPGGYAGLYVVESLYTAIAYPGLWPAAKIRELVDLWATSYRPAQHDVAIRTFDGSTFDYDLDWAVGKTEMDAQASFALLVALCIERGDSTVWSAHGAKVVGCLDALPRSGGLLYSTPGAPTPGWSYYDSILLTGGSTMISAYAALAYTRLAILADPSLMAQANSLIAGLETVKRSDGYWSASTIQTLADVSATAFIAAHGLCSTADQLTAGAALAKDYRAGIISHRGGMRALRSPETWPPEVNPNAYPADTYVNGGFWWGFRTEWACQAMAKAGYVDDARALMSEQVQGWLAQHRLNGNGPQEWFSKSALMGNGLTGSFAYGLLSAVEPPSKDIVLTLSGAALSSAVVPVDDGHAIDSIELLSGSSTTADIAVTAAARTPTAWADETGRMPNSAPTTKLAVLSTFQVFMQQFLLGINSALSWGGTIMAALTSGSSAGAIVLRLMQRGDRKPRLVSRSQSMTPWADTFDADSAESYIRSRPANWAVTGGYFGPTVTQVEEFALAPLRILDGDVESNLYTSFGTGYYPRLFARWKDQANYLFVQYAGGTTLQVIDVVAGVKTTIGSFTSTIADGVAQYTRIRLVGNQVTVTSGATSNTYTTNVTWPGLCGVGATCTNARVGFSQPTVQFRDLTITPVHTVQRDMNSDGLTPYTRTGTWTVSAARIRSVATTAPLVAYHADPPPQQSVGVTGTFTSADWTAKPTGLCTRASSASQLLYAICNGTTVSVYDRNAGVDTLLGSMTLAAQVANGADLTMTLRTHLGQVVVKVGSQYLRCAVTRAMTAGSAGAYCPNAGGSAAEISYSVLRVDTYPASQNHGQTIPPGHVLDGGLYFSATASDDTNAGVGHGGSLGPVYLRDESGAVVDSQADSDDVCVVY